ncbi:syf2 splicing factor family protein [Niveomyces insectorum RCEF 264]|uniref:Pre-mRNA-splicing factor SYF2 n=1 Tax=Niveomyces insectorum RCEF 264 TaxID=1081102 RepID=A0A168A4H3_9HYPO|nr:syf2 splicing factor family protein [Niveomyces insectorum RCEF 264]
MPPAKRRKTAVRRSARTKKQDPEPDVDEAANETQPEPEQELQPEPQREAKQPVEDEMALDGEPQVGSGPAKVEAAEAAADEAAADEATANVKATASETTEPEDTTSGVASKNASVEKVAVNEATAAESATAEIGADGADSAETADTATAAPAPAPAPAPASAQAPEPAPEPGTASEPAPTATDRMARFRALQARAKASSDQNLKAAAAETQRLSSDASQLASLRRKHAIATHKLLKSEVEDEGGDFERKRAWDWTAEESARWDVRMRKKAAHRDNNAFQDYTQEANKVYKRQLRANLLSATPNLEQYARDKLAAVERAAAEGSLDIVETEDGELVAVDKDGTFYSTAESTSFADNRPSKEAIDRLVNDQKKAEEVALRKRRERLARNGEDADVTFINEKNKQFNQKLARFYNKYTAEIRESFERGTMI